MDRNDLNNMATYLRQGVERLPPGQELHDLEIALGSQDFMALKASDNDNAYPYSVHFAISNVLLPTAECYKVPVPTATRDMTQLPTTHRFLKNDLKLIYETICNIMYKVNNHLDPKDVIVNMFEFSNQSKPTKADYYGVIKSFFGYIFAMVQAQSQNLAIEALVNTSIIPTPPTNTKTGQSYYAIPPSYWNPNFAWNLVARYRQRPFKQQAIQFMQSRRAPRYTNSPTKYTPTPPASTIMVISGVYI